MGRVAKTKFKILDFRVGEVKQKDGSTVTAGIVSVEIRKGQKYCFKRPYYIPKDAIKSFDWDTFKERIYTDAQKLITDKEFEDATLRRIEDFIGVEVQLD